MIYHCTIFGHKTGIWYGFSAVDYMILQLWEDTATNSTSWYKLTMAQELEQSWILTSAFGYRLHSFLHSTSPPAACSFFQELLVQGKLFLSLFCSIRQLLESQRWSPVRDWINFLKLLVLFSPGEKSTLWVMEDLSIESKAVLKSCTFRRVAAKKSTFFT